jgi:hypothetical protein
MRAQARLPCRRRPQAGKSQVEPTNLPGFSSKVPKGRHLPSIQVLCFNVHSDLESAQGAQISGSLEMQ